MTQLFLPPESVEGRGVVSDLPAIHTARARQARDGAPAVLGLPRSTRRLVGPLVEHAAALERPSEGEFVGVLEIAPHR